MPKSDSNPVAANLEPWSNDPWTNGKSSFPVKIVLDPCENYDHLLLLNMLAEPKINTRMR